MKKILSLVLAAMLCLGCVSALAEAEPTLITFYRLGGNTACTYADAAKVDEAINAYIEPLINVNIKTVIFHDAETLKMELAARDDIDIFFTNNWYGAVDCNNIVMSNGAKDLTEYLPNYPDLLAAIPESIWESTKYDGRNYFIPNYKESAVGVSLVCNKAVADKLGWTEEELMNIHDYKTLETYLKEAKDAGVGVPFITNASSSQGAYLRAERLGIDDFDIFYKYAAIEKKGDTTKIVIPSETETYADWAETIYRWNQNGYVPEDFGVIGVDNTELKSVLTSGDWAFTTWTTIPDTDGQIASQYDFEYILIPYSKNYITSESALGSAWAISSKSEKVDAALKFLTLLNTDKVVADLFVYGIEGVHYTVNEDGRLHMTEEGKGTYENSPWKACSVMVPSVMDTERADKASLYGTFNENGVAAPSNGFRFDASKVEVYLAALDNVVNEYAGLIDRGATEPTEALAAYNAALKAAGVDAVIAEMQAQYDAWMEATK